MGNGSRTRRLAPYLPLLLIAIGGFVFRLGVIEFLREPCATEAQATSIGDCYRFGGDSEYVAVQADQLLQGHGFVEATKLMFGVGNFDDPGAAHPPVFTLFLAALQGLGVDTVGGWRVATAAVGSIGVGLLGLAAWRLGGDRTTTTGRDSRKLGVIAAAVAAVNPLLWSRDTGLLVEALVVPLVAILVLVSLRLWRHPSWDNAAWLGIVIGIAWLTRTEQILLVVFLAPLFLRALDPVSMAGRLRLLAVTAGVAIVLMAPWAVYNTARFDRPVLTNNGGTALLLGACDATFYGPDFGSYTFGCIDEITTDPRGDEAVNDGARRDHAVTYLQDHAKRTPVVMAARFGRFWNLYRVRDTVEREALLEWSGWVPTRAGVAALYLLTPFAVAGGVHLHRRRIPLSPMLAPILVATTAAVTLLPLMRFRTPADAAVVLLAAPGLLVAARWVSSRVRPRRPPPLPSDRSAAA